MHRDILHAIQIKQIGHCNNYFVIIICSILLLNNIAVIQTCKISEFECRGTKVCLPLDKYCDGKNDCANSTDEPEFCTVCNRTYYGDVGRTYALKVPTPQWNRLPFFCHITFTASGQGQGDIVQIIFDAFSVGRFDEGLASLNSNGSDYNLLHTLGESPGCSDGFMQLSELGRPFTGGSWCGSAAGPQLYYSETSTVTASVKIYQAPTQSANPFEFRIRYKFISQSDAVVRYGTPNELLELGRITPGTYCTRQYEECYRKTCRLQSPNYPGMYPRNVTCYWTIRQKEIPTCKHAMISVSQHNPQKALSKRYISSINKSYRSSKSWGDCTGDRDHLIFYDGSSTNDPVLVKYCGGDSLPRVISRGSEMLVAFHSSPFSTPILSEVFNRGFELNVDILFADSDTYDFARNGNKNCEFHINATVADSAKISRRGRMGRILSPRHSLPPNTTCTYYFHGNRNDLIWIFFTEYNLNVLQKLSQENSTDGKVKSLPWISRLRIWDSMNSSTKSHAKFDFQFNANVTISPFIIDNTVDSYGYGIKKDYVRNFKVNIDTVWNPVDTYIYNPIRSSVFDYQMSDRINDLSIYANNIYNNFVNSSTALPKLYTSLSRKLITEVHDNETPMICDLVLLRSHDSHFRACSPFESYLSTGNDLKIEFHTYTGTTLFPASFSLNYEFIDTDLGGEPWSGKPDFDTQPPKLCSRIFRRKTGNFNSPRNVFLHGRGGAKNLTCLYRFEAKVGERVHITIHNISFGESLNCTTEPDYNTGRPLCSALNGLNDNGKTAELNIFDIPYPHIKISLGCFCDNSSLSNNIPFTIQSNTENVEILFNITKLHISEDFDDVYFYASYEYIRTPECQRRPPLMGSGGREQISYPIVNSCFASVWYIKPQKADRNIFLFTSGTLMVIDSTQSLTFNSFADLDSFKCHTKNRLLIYSGNPLKITNVICPAIYQHQSVIRGSTIHVYSSDAANSTFPTNSTKLNGLVVEAILKEPGSLTFQWLEIQSTKISALQNIDLAINYSQYETVNDVIFLTQDIRCEHQCPELNACVSGNLWCDGHRHCPSGFDESEEECGASRQLLEIPFNIIAGTVCLVALTATFVIFWLCIISRKAKKIQLSKSKAYNNNGVKNGIMGMKNSFFSDYAGS